jgi:hypothetical protein
MIEDWEMDEMLVLIFRSKKIRKIKIPKKSKKSIIIFPAGY